MPGKQGGGGGEGRQIPVRSDYPERRGETALPDCPAVKGRNIPARLPARLPTLSKCTSHLGFGLGDPAHLVAISSRHNRSKGARGPEEWKPPEDELWCQYAQDWAEIKFRWDLTMTEPEAEAVTEMLHTCENPPMVEVEVWVALETATGEQKPTPTKELQNSVYGSCEEAEAAGSRGCREAREEGRVSPKQWSRARETETGMAWSVKSRFSP